MKNLLATHNNKHSKSNKKKFKLDNVLVIELLLLVIFWSILYVSYLNKHDVPVNPGGFYLESAKQLVQNNFKPPLLIKGFSENGYPFVYPPLTFYIMGLLSIILGSILKVSLYLPGIFLLIQAVLMFFFVLRWRASKIEAGFAAMLIMLMPHMFYRSIFADGITTGLAGVFLLLSWISLFGKMYDLKPGIGSMIGGILVGLSILSHPAVGLFSAVSYVAWTIERKGFRKNTPQMILIAGISGLITISPWIIRVLQNYGVTPLISGLGESGSPLVIFSEPENALSTIKTSIRLAFRKYTHIDGQPTPSLMILPMFISMIYLLASGPVILIILVLIAFLLNNFHPVMSMFIVPMIAAIFLSKISNLISLNKMKIWSRVSEYIVSLTLLSIFSFFLIVINFSYINWNAFLPGEQETYEWIKVNTMEEDTILAPELDEKLVYFGERTLLLPVLGAEWLPSKTGQFDNFAVENNYRIAKLKECPTEDCFVNLLIDYQVFPDYLVLFKQSGGSYDWLNTDSDLVKFVSVHSDGSIFILRPVPTNLQ